MSLLKNPKKFRCDPVKWSVTEVTIRDFIQNWLPKIDCLPIHQRIDVISYIKEPENKKTPSKRQGIISTIVMGADISEIKINRRTAEEKEKFPQEYESIDGGNRKRSIKDFYNNKFPLNKDSPFGYKYFKDLTDEEREIFYNFKIRLVIYEYLTPSQKSYIWQSTNNSTPVNHQEMLNGMGDIPVANLIRETARHISGLNNLSHDFFDFTYNSRTNKIVPIYLTFDPTRLTYDRLVARIAVICHKGEKPVPCDDAQIEELYNDETFDKNRAKSIGKKIKEFLDFAQKVSVAKRYSVMNSKLTQEECEILYRLYYSCKERLGDFSISDFDEYYKRFNASFRRFNKKEPDAYALKYVKSYDKKSKEKKQRFVLFWENLNKRESMERWNHTVQWMENKNLTLDELIEEGIIVVKDEKRSATAEERESILHRQDGKCYIDGKPLVLQDAEAAHKIAHSKSGPTTTDNMVMVRKKYNKEMGSLNVDVYKKLYEEGRV